MKPTVSHDLVKDFTSKSAANRFTEKSTSQSSALNISPNTESLSATCSHRMTATGTANWNSGKCATRRIGASSDLIRAMGKHPEQDRQSENDGSEQKEFRTVEECRLFL